MIADKIKRIISGLRLLADFLGALSFGLVKASLNGYADDLETIQKELHDPGKQKTTLSTWKPSWDDAPHWAQYLAQSVNGYWIWFKEKPIPVKAGWMHSSLAENVTRIHDWKHTLEQRPGNFKSEPAFKRGCWVKHTSTFSGVVNIVQVQKSEPLIPCMPEGKRVYICRVPGTYDRVRYYEKDLELTTIYPDFHDAKPGDLCYNPIHGTGVIKHVQEKAIFVTCGNAGSDMVFEKEMKDTAHPGLYNSFEQFAAYTAELKLLNQGSEAKHV